MKSKLDSDSERDQPKTSINVILALFAGVVILMKSWLRRKKRSVISDHAVNKQHKVMKEPMGGLSASSIHESIQFRQSEYEQRKQRLLENDYEFLWYADAKRSATPSELRATEIVWKIREHERDNLFGNKASEAIPLPDTRDMGGQFLTNKDRIGRSRVYEIARKMPKGMHLHLHFNAELAPDALIRKAKDRPANMFVRSTRPLVTDEDYLECEIVFNILPDDTPSVDIFSPEYRQEFKAPGSTPWMLWVDFSKVLDQTGREPDAWIKQKMILSEEEVYGKTQTTNGVWARFNQATRCFKGLMNYESVFRWYIGEAIDNMIDDGVMYAELRPMLMDKFIPSDDGRRKLDHCDQMRMILEGVQRKQESLRAKNQLHKFPFGVKIIYCAPRSIPKPMMQREIDDCIKLKQAFPALICGFDLVGAEDRPNHIGYYRDELLAMQERCEQLGLEIPFMFHAGESLLDMGGSRNPANSNLYDAVLLKARRIGHGFSLLKHPILVEEFKKLDICIELCPTSNELLHLCRNIKEHPYPEILASGIPCTVNSDNPSLFSNSVSYEFYQIMAGSPTMNLHGWRQLAEWSIQYSCLTSTEKEEAYSIFKDEWERFCCWINDEFGAYADTLDMQM